MNNQEILTKAIQKAIDGGWNFWQYKRWSIEDPDNITGLINVRFDYGSDKYVQRFFIPVQAIIFNHDFAKALWGEELTITRRVPHSPFADDPDPNAIVITAPAWEHHLQQMVIAEDPIKYLGDHI